MIDDEDLDRRPPRRRYEEPLSSRLRKQLLSIAESSHKRVEDEIASIGATLAEHADDASLSSGFFELALQVVLEQPFKIPFVAAALVWANAGQAALGAEILERATQRLDGSVRVGAWREVKLLLRLLAGCQGMLEGDGIWSVLQDLLTKAVELQTGDNEEVRARWKCLHEAATNGSCL